MSKGKGEERSIYLAIHVEGPIWSNTLIDSNRSHKFPALMLYSDIRIIGSSYCAHVNLLKCLLLRSITYKCPK